MHLADQSTPAAASPVGEVAAPQQARIGGQRTDVRPFRQSVRVADLLNRKISTPPSNATTPAKEPAAEVSSGDSDHFGVDSSDSDSDSMPHPDEDDVLNRVEPYIFGQSEDPLEYLVQIENACFQGQVSGLLKHTDHLHDGHGKEGLLQVPAG